MDQLVYVGGLAGLVILLVVTIFLAWVGASLSEALYLSVLGAIMIGYSLTEWWLRWGR